MRTSPFYATLVLLGTSLLFFTCRRDDWDGDLFTSVDHSLAESEFSSLGNLVDYEARTNPDILGKTAETDGFYCPAAGITVTPDGNNATLLIDFGSGTNCLDGRLRTGSITAEFTGKWKDPGSRVQITPSGYTVSDVTGNVTYAVSFNYSILMNGRNADNQLNWTNTITDGLLIATTGERIVWEGTRTTTWIEGEGDLDLGNNVYSVTGTASGIARTGRPFTAETTSPLRVELDCPNVTAGTVEIVPQDLLSRSIDYGTGSCDRIAVLTVGTYSQEINLP